MPAVQCVALLCDEQVLADVVPVTEHLHAVCLRHKAFAAKLCRPAGGHSAHETNVRARQLQFCWEECQHATHAVSTTWPELRPEAHRYLLAPVPSSLCFLLSCAALPAVQPRSWHGILL